MPQVTLYIDEDTKARLEKAARDAGVSQSRWLAELIRERTSRQWPAGVAEAAGSWEDMPTAEELRQGLPGDVPREPA